MRPPSIFFEENCELRDPEDMFFRLFMLNDIKNSKEEPFKVFFIKLGIVVLLFILLVI
jgi:hypothetical protein